LSNRLANALKAHGIECGDRVGICLPQCPETAISYIAAFKIGAITSALSVLLGSKGLEYRLSNSEAKAVITNCENLQKILEIWELLPHLNIVILTDGKSNGKIFHLWELIEKGSDRLQPARTKSDDPALLLYTSGTTGPPKGALHAHRDLLGHLPCIEFGYNFFPMDGDIVWSPSDWAWIQGLMDVLFTSWHHGITVVSHPVRKFDPEKAFHVISKYAVRNAVIPPTALRMMKEVKDVKSRYNCIMRSILSGGSTLGADLLDWSEEVMGIKINEMYGQTETHPIVANCCAIMETRLGSCGRAAPGHEVEIVDDAGVPLPPDTIGEVAVERSSTAMFLGYWKDREATNAKQLGDWWFLGDLAKKDEDGYFYYIGRKDDLISSAGYRIGPEEIEDCLIKHPAVAMAAAVGSPDEIRTEVVKAFIVLKPHVKPSPRLEHELRNHVKVRLSAHEYPKYVEFVNELPLTTTGKIKRAVLREKEIKRKLKEKG
jgi:acetyl-CoA synthetase